MDCPAFSDIPARFSPCLQELSEALPRIPWVPFFPLFSTPFHLPPSRFLLLCFGPVSGLFLPLPLPTLFPTLFRSSFGTAPTCFRLSLSNPGFLLACSACPCLVSGSSSPVLPIATQSRFPPCLSSLSLPSLGFLLACSAYRCPVSGPSLLVPPLLPRSRSVLVLILVPFCLI